VSAEPPRRVSRVAVTAPPTHRRRRTTITSEIDAQTQLGEVYVRSLVRAQLRLALVVCAVLGVTVGLLPVLFVVVPALGEVHLLGVTLPWVVLGAGCYPVLIALAAWYVRRAERNERAFVELLDTRRAPGWRP
jgi:putative solute:sodium symporter small subunit